MKYGWKPDKPDMRDVRYRRIGFIDEYRLPNLVDLRPLCSTVEDQGELGSCTANALVGNLEYLEKKHHAWFLNFSRLFIYYNERVIEGTVNEDSGAEIRDGIKALVYYGVCSEKSWPYNVSMFTHRPYSSCYREALTYKIISYTRLDNIDQMRDCLAQGFPFVFGFSVYESFESYVVAETGVAPMPRCNERLLGGHAVMAVGYDNTKKVFIIRNSWGTEWGMKGYFTLPYDYLSNRDLSDDFWTIRRGGGM